MTKEELLKSDLTDFAKEVILDRAIALNVKYKTPLNDAIRIMYNTLSVDTTQFSNA